MLGAILRKRVRVLGLILVLSALLTVTTAFAITQLIKAREGGTIRIARGVKLVIRPGALEEDTVISANMVRKRNRIYFHFGPNGTTFAEDKPAKLMITWRAMADMGLSDFTLHGQDGEEIEPNIGRRGLSYGLKSFSLYHFSLYYYRRR